VTDPAPASSRNDPPPDRHPEGLRLPQYLGYGAGDAANNLAFSLTSMFLLLYYTDVVGLAAATVGTLFLVVRVFDAFADLFAGRVVDRTNTRWGRFRPFLLLAGVPLLLLNIAVFTVPDLGRTGTLAYAYVTYLVFGLAYSLTNIPYGSLATAMTQDPDERSKLATFRVFGSNIAILTLAVVVSPQIQNAEDLQRSLTITTMALAVVGTGLYLLAFGTSAEQVGHGTSTSSLRQSFSNVRQNKALLVLCGSSVIFLVGWFSLQTVTVFYARDVLGNADYYIVLTIVQTVGVFAAALLVPQLVPSLGKKRVYMLLGAVAVASGVVVGLAPSSVPAIAIVTFGFFGVGLGGVNTVSFALQSDTVEYGEWRTGVRGEGATYSVFSFTRKVGQAVGAAAASYAIGIGGYRSGAADQPDSAVAAIKVSAGLVPAAFVLGAIALMSIYPLTEERFRAMVRELARRHAGQEGLGSGTPGGGGPEEPAG
jgi:glucuronide carrier protein